MGNEAAQKFTWVIKNFSPLQSKSIFSDEFVIGGCHWYLMAFPKGVQERQPKNLSLYLVVVADFGTLPCGWRRHAKFSLTVVNQLSEKLSHVKERQCWFDKKKHTVGYPEMIPLTKLHDKDGGFLVNNEVKIVVEIDVLEVIGNLDVSVESQEVTQPRKKTKLNDDGVVSSHLHMETSSVKESTIDVNGFQVLPSQVDFARHVFEKYPEIALECRTKNQDLRTSYMNVLLSLIKMLFKSPQDASTDDLSDAEAALAYMKNVGFKLDWLEKKLDQVKEIKKKCARVCEMEQQLHDLDQQMHDLKQKSEDLETQLNKEKAEILEATTPDLSFNDVI